MTSCGFNIIHVKISLNVSFAFFFNPWIFWKWISWFLNTCEFSNYQFFIDFQHCGQRTYSVYCNCLIFVGNCFMIQDIVNFGIPCAFEKSMYSAVVGCSALICHKVQHINHFVHIFYVTINLLSTWSIDYLRTPWFESLVSPLLWSLFLLVAVIWSCLLYDCLFLVCTQNTLCKNYRNYLRPRMMLSSSRGDLYLF